MKASYLSLPYTTKSSESADVNTSVRKTPENTASPTGQHPHLRPADYIIEALGEGIKSNFLGYNIDVEFLTLSIRSLAVSSARVIQERIIKPIATRYQRGYHSLTQTSF
jgi:hypothetical protein